MLPPQKPPSLGNVFLAVVRWVTYLSDTIPITQTVPFVPPILSLLPKSKNDILMPIPSIFNQKLKYSPNQESYTIVLNILLNLMFEKPAQFIFQSFWNDTPAYLIHKWGLPAKKKVVCNRDEDFFKFLDSSIHSNSITSIKRSALSLTFLVQHLLFTEKNPKFHLRNPLLTADQLLSRLDKRIAPPLKMKYLVDSILSRHSFEYILESESKPLLDYSILLDRLWEHTRILLGSDYVMSAITPQISDLYPKIFGFQYKDPTSDFRALGPLLVKTMIYIIQSFPVFAKDLILKSIASTTKNYYSFALFTSRVCSWVRYFVRLHYFDGVIYTLVCRNIQIQEIFDQPLLTLFKSSILNNLSQLNKYSVKSVHSKNAPLDLRDSSSLASLSSTPKANSNNRLYYHLFLLKYAYLYPVSMILKQFSRFWAQSRPKLQLDYTLIETVFLEGYPKKNISKWTLCPLSIKKFTQNATKSSIQPPVESIPPNKLISNVNTQSTKHKSCLDLFDDNESLYFSGSFSYLKTIPYSQCGIIQQLVLFPFCIPRGPSVDVKFIEDNPQIYHKTLGSN